MQRTINYLPPATASASNLHKTLVPTLRKQVHQECRTETCRPSQQTRLPPHRPRSRARQSPSSRRSPGNNASGHRSRCEHRPRRLPSRAGQTQGPPPRRRRRHDDPTRCASAARLRRCRRRHRRPACAASQPLRRRRCRSGPQPSRFRRCWHDNRPGPAYVAVVVVYGVSFVIVPA